MSGDGLYLYGIVPAGERPAIGEAPVGGGAEPPRTLDLGGVGVIASPHPTGEVLPRRRDLKAHARVLEAVGCPLLPIRFGTVAASPAAIERARSPRLAELLGLLERFAGKAEYGVRIRVSREALLSEVIAASPSVRQRHAAISGKGEAGRYEMIEFGRWIGEALEERRRRHQKSLLAGLRAVASDHVLRAPETEGELLRADLLAERRSDPLIAERLEQLATPLGAEARLVGPVPVYSFIDLRIEFAG